ncbi:DUF2470 domain-containing protein [Streptomonospora litoralis]|uniref:DUF2470 domain-containing protein n=1 Tax=Streptomonospora litoralis TaxID=2498135 RepID=A0A4P6Q4W2_9ACTN|nr:DUF2470 domain-containing protein [Streptomonospora litoralis]QBI53777.1 hypothetical protein EKD16_09945 [Streptomonospora litoralis]
MRQPSPSGTERVRSLAATATPTAAALADNPDTRFSVAGAVDHAGRVLLWVAAHHPLHEALREGRRTDPGPEVGIDLSALRRVGRTSTVRARLWCQGRAEPVPDHERRRAALAVWERDPDEELLAAAARQPEPDASVLLRVPPRKVIYHTYDAAGVIEGSAFTLARPDPLTVPGERIIDLVNDRYRDELARAVGRLPDAPRGAAWLWELDARGATTWVNAADGGEAALVRVPWSAPVHTACQLERALFDFLADDAADSGPAGSGHRRGCPMGEAHRHR